jgi:hypothetical protein
MFQSQLNFHCAEMKSVRRVRMTRKSENCFYETIALDKAFMGSEKSPRSLSNFVVSAR